MITWRKPGWANDEVDGCYPIRDLLDIYPNPSGINAAIERSEMKSWIHVHNRRLFGGDDEKEDMYGPYGNES